MKVFDTVSRRAFALLAAVSCAVCAAVPAAADVVFPTWYHGAVKAMDRMGISEADYPVWLRSDVASRIPQMHGDYVIDADLADRKDGVMSDDDVDAAVDRRAARLVYKDVTVDLVKLWGVYGKVYADGYSKSTSGALHYGDAGYIPTSDEIDEWSRKLTVTTSELDRQAEENVAALDSSSGGASPSAWRSVCGGGASRARAAAFMVRPIAGVKTYNDRKLKKSEEYKRLHSWKLDDGSEYSRDILEREEYTGADDAFSGKDRKSAAANEAANGDDALARDRRIAKRKQMLAQAHRSFNAAADAIGDVLNILGIRDAAHDVLNIAMSDDTFCSLVHETKGDNFFQSSARKFFRFTGRANAGIDCDDFDARAEAAADAVAKKIADAFSDPNNTDPYHTALTTGEHDPMKGYTVSWSPWYVAQTPDGNLYVRTHIWRDSAGHEFTAWGGTGGGDAAPIQIRGDAWLKHLCTTLGGTASCYRDGEPVNYDLYNPASDVRRVFWIGPSPDITTSGPLALWGHIWDHYNYSGGTTYGAAKSLEINNVATATRGFMQSYDSFYNGSTGAWDGGSWLVPGDSKTVLSKIRLYYGSPRLEDNLTHFYADDEGTINGTPFNQYKTGHLYGLAECGKSCPESLTAAPSVRVVSTPKDAAGNPVGSGSSGPAYDGSGTPMVPSDVSVPVGADGKTTASNVSYDAVSSDGTSIHVGDQAIPQIDTSTISKRLDLIDLRTGRSCFSEGYACASWYTETQQLVPDHQLTVSTKTTTKEQPALTYKCSYDVPGKISEVPIGECVAYAHAFEEAAQRSGATASDPDGDAIADPVTSADPRVDYGTCLRQETAGSAAKWLYEPVACAGRMLFKPDDKVTRTTRTKVERSTRDSVVVKLDLIRENWRPVFTDGLGDCSGYHVSFKFAGIPVFDDADFLDACPGQPLDWLPVLCRAFLTIVCALGVMLLCRRAFMAIFDFHTGGDGQ
ncbi:hypothetical protein ACTQ29_06970 [Bifidobacterium boum]|uniref:hypothetical protein n=1 Tax=Bifidobacterium boum TaxID=78343 RepID=UPI003F8F5588